MVWSGVAELGRLVSGLFLISVNSVSLGTTFQSLLLPVQVPYLTPRGGPSAVILCLLSKQL